MKDEERSDACVGANTIVNEDEEQQMTEIQKDLVLQLNFISAGDDWPNRRLVVDERIVDELPTTDQVQVAEMALRYATSRHRMVCAKQAFERAEEEYADQQDYFDGSVGLFPDPLD